MFFVEESFTMSMRIGKHILSIISSHIHGLIIARSRIFIFYIIKLLLKLKNLADRLGLNTFEPVPLCFDIEYFPVDDNC